MAWGLIGNAAPWTNLSVTSINMPSTGMFTWQASYGIANCTDGTSNTIAYSEACVGNQSERPKSRLVGLQNVAIPLTSMLYDAQSNPAVTQAVIALRNAAYH